LTLNDLEIRGLLSTVQCEIFGRIVTVTQRLNFLSKHCHLHYCFLLM